MVSTQGGSTIKELAPAALNHVMYTPSCTKTTKSTHHLEPGNGNILSHLPALILGPAGDIGLPVIADPREEAHSNDDGLHQTPATPIPSYRQTLKSKEHQSPHGPLKQTATKGGLPGPEPNKEPPDKPPDLDDCNEDL